MVISVKLQVLQYEFIRLAYFYFRLVALFPQPQLSPLRMIFDRMFVVVLERQVPWIQDHMRLYVVSLEQLQAYLQRVTC